MYTIIDVARLAGVSTATVSNVINKNGKVAQKTEEKVLQAIKELNYIPNHIAKGLKTNSTQNIGIIVEDINAFSSSDIIDGICSYCEEFGYTVHLTNLRVHQKIDTPPTSHYDQLETSIEFKTSIENNINHLLSSRISGLIYIGVHPRDVSRLIPKLDIPIVYAYAYATKEDSSVNYDDFQGAKLSVDYLIQMNHQKIAIISGPINSFPSHQRLLGYQTSLIENGINYLPEYIKIGNWHYEDGYRLCNELLDLSAPPTAIFAMNDLMAIGVINAAKDRSLCIPDDLSIHGFDNLRLTDYLRPSLCTVDLQLKTIGIRSAKVLIEKLTTQNSTHDQVKIPCKHIPRDSVKKLSL